MELIKPIVYKRSELLNNSASKKDIEDVIFSIVVSENTIQNVDVFLTPYIGLLSSSDKKIAAKMVLDKILDRTYFTENDIEFSDRNLILFFSFDSIDCIDNCYIVDLKTNNVTHQLYGMHGNIIEEIILSKDSNHKDSLEKKHSPVFLLFDTETTGLPKDYKAPESDLSNWPRMIQLAYILYDSSIGIISEGNYIIKPIDFDIPLESSKIHGITKQRALTEGSDLDKVLIIFEDMVNKADYMVAHNIDFDKKILGAEFLRRKNRNPIISKKMICTMSSTTNYCAIEGKYGYKWPTLQELHYKLFKENFQDAHDASIDVSITLKCFEELLKNKVIKLN